MAKATNTDWNSFEVQGKNDHKIRAQLDQLIDEYQKNLPDNPFEKDATNPLSFTKEFSEELKSKFHIIFSQFPDLTPKQKNHWKKSIIKQLTNLLDLLVRKKALCTIQFQSNLIHNFILALTNISEEVRFKIQKEHLFVSLYDDNVISLAKIQIHNETYAYYREGIATMNLKDFEKMLKADQYSDTTLVFGQDDIYITVLSQKFKIPIERVLNQIDLPTDEANFLLLDELKYCCNFEINKEQLQYLIGNLGRYSEVFDIECTPENLIFNENGQIGSGSISFTKDKISRIELHKDNEEDELRECEYFSLPYLRKLYKLCSILDKDDLIQFFLTKDQPLKCIVNFGKLGNTKTTFYFAPRVERDEYEDQEDFEQLDDSNEEEGIETPEDL